MDCSLRSEPSNCVLTRVSLELILALNRSKIKLLTHFGKKETISK